MSAAACTSGNSRGEAIRVDTLENGAVLVSNPTVGLWGRRAAWPLTDEVKIGARDGGGAGVFGLVTQNELDDLAASMCSTSTHRRSASSSPTARTGVFVRPYSKLAA